MRRWSRILIVAVPALLLLPATALIALVSLPLPIGIAVTTCAAAAHATLLLAHRAPTVTLLLITALIAAQAALTAFFVLLPSSALILLALHAVAARGSRRVAIAIAALAPALTTARYAMDPTVTGSGFGPAPWLLGVALLAVCAVAVLMGLLRRAELRTAALLEERLDFIRRDQDNRQRQAASAERSRISGELHDVLGHSLTVIVAQARVARFTPARTAPALEVIEETARTSLRELRQTLRTLQEGHADAPSPAPVTPDALAERMRGLGLSVERRVQGVPRRLNSDSELALGRFLQEGLTNALRHGTGGVEWIEDWRDDLIVIRLSNPVAGDATTGDGTGLGLPAMRKRIAAVGGHVEVASDGPFTVIAVLPYAESTALGTEAVR